MQHSNSAPYIKHMHTYKHTCVLSLQKYTLYIRQHMLVAAYTNTSYIMLHRLLLLLFLIVEISKEEKMMRLSTYSCIIIISLTSIKSACIVSSRCFCLFTRLSVFWTRIRFIVFISLFVYVHRSYTSCIKLYQ